MKTQLRENYYVPFVKKAFMSKTSLKYHEGVSHSASASVKNVKCKLCDKTFRHALSLKRHIKSMHSEDPEMYQCEECYKTFRRTMLGNDWHIISHHPMSSH